MSLWDCERWTHIHSPVIKAKNEKKLEVVFENGSDLVCSHVYDFGPILF
jgi:hypothetical protein